MRSIFKQELLKANSDPADRRWIFVPYDQVTDKIGPLVREPAEKLGIILVENVWKPGRRPYHKQKLAFILANLRHFALEQARRGVAVIHLAIDGPYREALERVLPDVGGKIFMMRAAERELRVDLQPLVDDGRLVVLPHEGWLTSSQDFIDATNLSPPWRMDAFYRKIRQRQNILMVDGKPVGGKYSFDTENRQRWSGIPAAPELPSYPIDPIKEEVGRLIDQHFSEHPGVLDLTKLAATVADAEHLWSWARKNALPLFGPYEDAMSVNSSNLFHTHVSTLLNIGRLLPRNLINDVLALEEISLASREGFVRQILGWREYMRHIHESTDGFRKIPGAQILIADTPGDGGYELWAGKPWIDYDPKITDPDGGAKPSYLDAHNPLPPAYWGAKSGLNCLDRVVESVWNEGYSHHITRLMVLSNIAALLDIEPRQLTDWFWVAYTDAYDWVVEPNVLVMGTYAVGDIATTKPYISGAAYINKMSDFCRGCKFDPSKNCPITPMYWAYLERHKDKLSSNFRLQMPINSLAKRADEKKESDRKTYSDVLKKLLAGEILHPGDNQLEVTPPS
jgi:deoxyribodipyrimidine photolyase-related protein